MWDFFPSVSGDAVNVITVLKLSNLSILVIVLLGCDMTHTVWQVGQPDDTLIFLLTGQWWTIRLFFPNGSGTAGRWFYSNDV